ncbi:hypothetical protein IY230_02200, partial [Acholeplasma laidlawii]|nr:hypothetical protein [Acholeplasma laidlawii]
EFSLKNTTTGSKSGQIWIISIDITYGGTGSVTPGEDTVAPVISGAKDITYVIGSTAPNYLAGVSATDDVDGVVQVAVDASDVNLEVAGTYDVIYTATDLKGNVAEVVVQITVTDGEEPVVGETYTFRLTPEKNVTPKGTSYVDVLYLESHGQWDGKTNKASSTTFGTNGSTNALEFIANEGYYVYSVQVLMGSASGSDRTLTAINLKNTSQTKIVVSGVSTSSSPKDSGIVILGFESNSVKFQSSGALTYYWIEVVVKSNPQ